MQGGREATSAHACEEGLRGAGGRRVGELAQGREEGMVCGCVDKACLPECVCVGGGGSMCVNGLCALCVLCGLYRAVRVYGDCGECVCMVCVVVA